MIDDIAKSIKAELYDRVTSPLLGAFLVSWPVWNYKALLILFSGMEPLAKIAILEGQIYPTFMKGFSFILVLPLISALAYLFLYPVPARFVFRHARGNHKTLKEIKVEIEDETPVSQTEYNRIRRKVADMESDYYSGLASKDAEIARLKALLGEGESRPSQNRSRKPKSTESVDVPEVSGEHPIITSVTVAGERYELGKDFKKDKPGQVNVVKLRSEHEFRETISVSFETSIPLIEGQEYKVFDGHSQFSPEKPEFELHKTDYEQKSAFIVVEQPNPLRNGKPIVISNKVQFAY